VIGSFPTVLPQPEQLDEWLGRSSHGSFIRTQRRRRADLREPDRASLQRTAGASLLVLLRLARDGHHLSGIAGAGAGRCDAGALVFADVASSDTPNARWLPAPTGWCC
jgi:hypothetical protein